MQQTEVSEMKRRSSISFGLAMASCLAGAAFAHDAPADAGPDIYANTEENYFDNDAGRDAAPWLSLRFDGQNMAVIDAFGAAVEKPELLEIIERTEDQVTARIDGQETVLRKARAVTCWGAARKPDEPDKSKQWLFERGLNSHDQGGRVRFGGGDTGAPETILRIRHVTWPEGSSNRPSLVLYVHSADDPDRAVSYSWADENASRVGINLRWMQASCTVADA